MMTVRSFYVSPKDALQVCEKMHRSLKEAFSSLIRILIGPPKVVRPKLLDSQVLQKVAVAVDKILAKSPDPSIIRLLLRT